MKNETFYSNTAVVCGYIMAFTRHTNKHSILPVLLLTGFFYWIRMSISSDSWSLTGFISILGYMVYRSIVRYKSIGKYEYFIALLGAVTLTAGITMEVCSAYANSCLVIQEFNLKKYREGLLFIGNWVIAIGINGIKDKTKEG